jgi:hypothetical protein
MFPGDTISMNNHIKNDTTIKGINISIASVIIQAPISANNPMFIF